jgi:hypothetical protein
LKQEEKGGNMMTVVSWQINVDETDPIKATKVALKILKEQLSKTPGVFPPVFTVVISSDDGNESYEATNVEASHNGKFKRIG